MPFYMAQTWNWLWLIAVPLYVLLELPYLFLLSPVHQTQLSRMTNNSPLRSVSWPAVVAFYSLVSLGTLYLVQPSADTVRDAVARGAVMGAVMYGTYDITLLAVLGPALMPPWYAVMDMIWGTLVMATVHGITAKIAGTPW